MDPYDATKAPLAALADRFDLLAADATQYALFLADPSGILLCWNLGAERLYGYRTDESIGQHFSRFYTPEDVINGQPEYDLKMARADGRSGGVRWQVRKDGSRFWCKATTTALYNEARGSDVPSLRCTTVSFEELNHAILGAGALDCPAGGFNSSSSAARTQADRERCHLGGPSQATGNRCRWRGQGSVGH